MEHRNDSRRGSSEEVGITIAGRPVPYQSGVLPDDFPQRLIRLKKASGLTWNAFADALGCDRQQVYMWRKHGTEPCGGAHHSLVKLAAFIPGGLHILMGEGFQLFPWQDWQD